MEMWETTGGEREAQDEKCPTLREGDSTLDSDDSCDNKNMSLICTASK